MPPSRPDPTDDAPRPRWHPLRIAFRWTAGIVLFAWSLLLIAWLILHWGILPNAREWRPQIEAQASRVLGVTVTIGDIRVQSSGWVPAVELVDVVLRDPRQRESLRLPHVAAALSARSLWTLNLRLEQLLIDGADLEIRRDPLGRIHVAGLELSGDGGGDTALADWFFEQHEFVIRNGRLRWVDEQRLAPPLALEAVDLVVRNGLRSHAIRIDATPPAGWGDRFSMRARFTGPLWSRSGEWRRWSGTAHADLPRADVAELRRYVDLPFELTSGEGALRAWVDVSKGSPRSATVDAALRRVSLRLASHVEPLAMARIGGRFSAERDGDRLDMTAHDFSFETDAGGRWPVSDLRLVLRGPRTGLSPVLGGELSASRLDLALMAGIAGSLPMNDTAREAIAHLAPEGLMLGLDARWDGAPQAPTRYQVKARMTGLGIEAGPSAVVDGVGRPGWRQAVLDLKATETGGQATLQVENGSLTLPGVFRVAEVPLDRLSAQVGWRITPGTSTDAPPQIEVRVQEARFANADAEGEFSGTWKTGAGTGVARGGRYPGVLDLTGRLTRGNAEATARYLPLGIPQSMRDYIGRAVTDGRIGSAAFKVRGDLWEFPFYNAKDGEFRVALTVEDVEFAYVPSEPGWESPWPGLQRVSGDLIFDRTSMEVRQARARIDGIDLQNVSGGIRNLVDKPVVTLDGQARGPAADMLRFVNASPVGRWIGGALSQATAGGIADLRLALEVPLEDVERSKVRGTVTLGGNDVRIRPGLPLLAGARARVDFTQRGFTVAGGAARVFGGDASFEGGSQPDGSLRFTGQGLATADGLRRATDMPSLARLAKVLTGQAAYRLSLAVTQGHPELNLTSNLVGLGIDLPAPLGKTADGLQPLRFQNSLLASAASATSAPAGAAASVAATSPALTDRLRIDLGSAVQAVFIRDVSGDAPVVLRGGIGIFDGAPLPASGVAASLRLPALDADAWRVAAARWANGPASPGVATDYLPSAVVLNAQELIVDQRKLSNLQADLTRTGSDGTWQASVAADQLSGRIEWRPAAGPSQPGRVLARLERLQLPPADAYRIEAMLARAPATVPALDIEIDELELRGRKLGRVVIEAGQRVAADGRREWRLGRLDMTTPEATLRASGQWRLPPAGASPPDDDAARRMQVSFQLDLRDSGAFLERLGAGAVVRGGTGKATGQLSWAGSPLSLHVPTLRGDIRLDVDQGQVLKAGPGAGRLLSVLSLQSLQRRLALDFRDVFDEGFAFDNVSGDVAVADGVARTNNLRMRGLQAAILAEGSADLASETQDLQVLVVPEINAGTASLAYATINPAIGLGTFVAQLFLRRPLMQANTREFHVSGSWADPQVQRVERPIGKALPELDPPAALPAAPPPVTRPN